MAEACFYSWTRPPGSSLLGLSERCSTLRELTVDDRKFTAFIPLVVYLHLRAKDKTIM